jgi:hypothetical protein
MTQLVAEKALMVLNAVGKAKRPEYASALDQEILDAPNDQDSYQIVVKGIPRLMASRHGLLDETHRVIDHRRRDRQCLTVSIASHHDRHFRPCDQRSDIVRPGV